MVQMYVMDSMPYTNYQGRLKNITTQMFVVLMRLLYDFILLFFFGILSSFYMSALC